MNQKQPAADLEISSLKERNHRGGCRKKQKSLEPRRTQMFMTMVRLCHESFSHRVTETQRKSFFSLHRVSVPPWQFSFTAKEKLFFVLFVVPFFSEPFATPFAGMTGG